MVTDAQRCLHVCFVCSGNICRSPIAEKVMATALDGAGLAGRVRVTSAGLGNWHVGGPADERAAALLRQHGYPDHHVARQVGRDCLDADLLVALDKGHLRELASTVADPARVRLLRSFDPTAPPGAEVPDPYWGGSGGFDDVLRMIESAVPGLLDWVRRRLAE